MEEKRVEAPKCFRTGTEARGSSLSVMVLPTAACTQHSGPEDLFYTLRWSKIAITGISHKIPIPSQAQYPTPAHSTRTLAFLAASLPATGWISRIGNGVDSPPSRDIIFHLL
jgi:hypothetical protein